MGERFHDRSVDPALLISLLFLLAGQAAREGLVLSTDQIGSGVLVAQFCDLAVTRVDRRQVMPMRAAMV